MFDSPLGLNVPTGLTAALGAILWELLRIVLAKWNVTLPAMPMLPKPAAVEAQPVTAEPVALPVVVPVKDFKTQLQEFLEIRKLLKELQD